MIESTGTGSEGSVRRPRDRRDTENRDEKRHDAVIDENDIDQILADSFPASDAPPWTLGVIQATETVKREEGYRVNRR